jgi:ketosteroid isomerase-like protein
MKAQSMQLIGIVLCGVALAACDPREHELPSELIYALQTHYNSNDPERAAELFTEDGAIMTEFGDTVHGQAAIIDFLQGEIDKRLQYWVTSEESGVSGGLGYDVGSMRVRDINRARDLEMAKYITLSRMVGSEWKIYRTIYNTNSLSGCASVQVAPMGDGAESR